MSSAIAHLHREAKSSHRLSRWRTTIDQQLTCPSLPPGMFGVFLNSLLKLCRGWFEKIDHIVNERGINLARWMRNPPPATPPPLRFVLLDISAVSSTQVVCGFLTGGSQRHHYITACSESKVPSGNVAVPDLLPLIRLGRHGQSITGTVATSCRACQYVHRGQWWPLRWPLDRMVYILCVVVYK